MKRLTAATEKSKLTRAVWPGRKSMNAKLAKKLRKIARGLELDPKLTRRAYKEAKKIYLGKPLPEASDGRR